MATKPKRMLSKKSLEFEMAITGVALAALFIGPMWMDYLHNNWPGEYVGAEAVIGGVCTVCSLLILGRLLWIYRD